MRLRILDALVEYGALEGLSSPVSRLVLGTLSFRRDQLDRCGAVLEHYLAVGGTMVDSALVYENGESERALGELLHRLDEDVLVLTKGAHHDADGTSRVDPREIGADLCRSLEHLQRDRIDLYMLHRDDPAVAVGPIVECLNAAREEGLIGAYGVSNWAHARIAEANAFARSHGLPPFVASSPNLALAVPHAPIAHNAVSIAGDDEAMAWYGGTRLPVLAWSAQASGFFSGRFAPHAPPNPSVAPYYTHDNWERLERVRALARLKGCSQMQLALAWVLHQPLEVFALIGPRTVDELGDCLGALEVPLTPKELAWLDLRESALERGLGAARRVTKRIGLDL